QRQAHRHAVVVVRLDLGSVQRPRGDREPVRPYFYFRTQAPQFGRQCRDAVCFFVADVGDIADARRPVGEAGDCGQGHDRVADGIHVHVDAAEGTALDGNAGFALLDAAAHLLKQVHEADVALETVFGKPLDGDVAAENRRGGPE